MRIDRLENWGKFALFIALATSALVLATGCTAKREKKEYAAAGASIEAVVAELRALDTAIRPHPSDLANSLQGDPRAALSRNVTMARACIAAHPILKKLDLKASDFEEPGIKADVEGILRAVTDFETAVKVCESHGDLYDMDCPLKCVPAWNKFGAALAKLRVDAQTRGITTPDLSSNAP